MEVVGFPWVVSWAWRYSCKASVVLRGQTLMTTLYSSSPSLENVHSKSPEHLIIWVQVSSPASFLLMFGIHTCPNEAGDVQPRCCFPSAWFYVPLLGWLLRGDIITLLYWVYTSRYFNLLCWETIITVTTGFGLHLLEVLLKALSVHY